MIITVLLCVVLSYVACKLWNIYWDDQRDPTCPYPLPPGSMGIPFLGEMIHFIFEMVMGIDFFKRRRLRHGLIYKTHIMGKPTIRVIGPESVKKVLLGERILVASSWPQASKLLLGEESLSMSTGYEHQLRRKYVRGALDYTIISKYIAPVQTIMTEEFDSWCRQGDVDVFKQTKLLALRMSCRCLLGLSYKPEEALTLVQKVESFTGGFFTLPITFPGTAYSKALKAKAYLTKRIRKRLQDKSQEDDNEQSLDDALKIIMRHSESNNRGRSVTNEEIQQMAAEFLFTGHITVASAMCSTVMLLAMYPDVWEKLVKELSAHNLLDPAMELDRDALNDLPYVDKVVTEVLRLCPPVGGGYRKAIKTFEIGGYQIPKDWAIIYSIKDTHDTSDLFMNNEVFDPERWEKIGAEHPPPFHFLPFGAGARSCAGKKFAMLMVTLFTVCLVRSCTWKLKNKDSHKHMLRLPALHPKDGLPAVFSQRQR